MANPFPVKATRRRMAPLSLPRWSASQPATAPFAPPSRRPVYTSPSQASALQVELTDDDDDWALPSTLRVDSGDDAGGWAGRSKLANGTPGRRGQQQQQQQPTTTTTTTTPAKPTHEVQLTSRSQAVRKIFDLAEGRTMLLGRASSSKGGPGGFFDGWIRCPVMSKAHAELRVRNGIVYVVDVGSLHGTQLNGLALAEGVEKALKDGDSLSLGKTVIKSGIRTDALVLDISIQTMSSRIVPPLTPPAPEKLLGSAGVSGSETSSSEPPATVGAAKPIAGMDPISSEHLHSPSHGRYGLSQAAAEGDIVVNEILDDDNDEVEVVSVRSASQSVDSPHASASPEIEVVEVVSPKPTSSAAVAAVSVIEPDEPEHAEPASFEMAFLDMASNVSDTVGRLPTESVLESPSEGASLLAADDAESELGRTERDFRSPRPGEEDEPATSSCIRRLSSPPVAEVVAAASTGDIEADEGKSIESGKELDAAFTDLLEDLSTSVDEFISTINEFPPPMDDGSSAVHEDESRDASALQLEPQIFWRQASPSDRQAALSALRISRDRRQKSQCSASKLPKPKEPTRASSPPVGSPFSHASVESLSDLFPAVDFDAVAADDDMSNHPASGSSVDEDEREAVEVGSTEPKGGIDLKLNDEIEWPPLPSQIIDGVEVVPVEDVGMVATDGPSPLPDMLGAEFLDAKPWNPWSTSDELASSIGNPAPTAGMKRRREPEDDGSSMPATKTASVQATPPELVSTATSTDGEAAEHVESLQLINGFATDAIASLAPESASLTAAAVTIPFERTFAVPEAAVIQAAAIQAVQSSGLAGPISASVAVATPTAASAVTVTPPEVASRPTKRARLGTFIAGVLAGSVLSIGALASYGAGELA